jgi:hypothetical protein
MAPALFSGEQGLHKLQLGFPEAVRGTPETTTILVPADSSSIIAEDRGYASPNEDYGVLALHQPDRGIYGVRLATLPFRSVGLFEYFRYHAAMLLEGGIVATHPIAGVDKYVYTRDMTGDSLDTGTWQEGDNESVFHMAYAAARQARMSFSSLGAPSNVPVQLDIEYFGDAKTRDAGGFDADAAAILNPEPIVGQTARAYLGSPATAFAALPEAVGLLAEDLTIPSGTGPRKYGSATDKFTHLGKVKSAPSGSVTLFETDARVADLWALWADDDQAVHNLRMRLEFTGRDIVAAHPYLLQLDGLVQLTTLPVINDPSGGRAFQANVDYAYDADLGSDFVATLIVPTPV